MDTIVALSTPPGRSGIGIIRLSGPDALSIISGIIRDREFDPEPRRASLCELLDPETGDVLDEALVTYFKSPNSFTGEDVVELSCHGAPVLLRKLIDIALDAGARLATPGEFTLRALKNGRLGLDQAEAIRDLINAQTEAAARQAVRKMKGELSTQLAPLKQKLIDIVVPLESSLEFVEDDLPDLAFEKIERDMIEAIANIRELAGSFQTGRLLKEGLKITLAGRPNVGKSSVFNRLLARERAIVTELPGTTRDTLQEVMNLRGVPVLLNDTAGVRDSRDTIEALGIERTRQAIVEADLVVIVLDGSEPLNSEDRRILTEVRDLPHIVVCNKMDLPEFELNGDEAKGVLGISARTGAGLDELRAVMIDPFMSGDAGSDSLLITDARHFDLLRRAGDELVSSQALLKQRASEELILVGVYNALRYLGQITGETTPDDILSEIFSSFCIGK